VTISTLEAKGTRSQIRQIAPSLGTLQPVERIAQPAVLSVSPYSKR
jgi:hypothetical protein